MILATFKAGNFADGKCCLLEMQSHDKLEEIQHIDPQLLI